MSEVQSPTETGADQDSSDIRDESQLEQNQQDQSADYDESDNSSDEQQSESSQSQDEAQSNEQEVDDKLAKFAKSQGIEDVSELSKREFSLLKAAHDNRVAARSKKPGQDIKEATKSIFSGESGDTEAQSLARDIRQLKAKEAINDYFNDNPDDREFEKAMGEVLKEEADKYGKEAAERLFNNLPRLAREAKFKAGAYDSDAARESGRRDEREALRKRQEGSADAGHASSSIKSTGKKFTRESIASMSDDEFAQNRDEIDAAILRGELY